MSAGKVLVVDDDPQILEVMARALTAPGRRVSTARRASLAREVLARQHVDLVVTDVRMPGETGLDLAETTRFLGIATILMSGDPEWSAEHGLAAADYLAKPFALATLLQLVETHLERDTGRVVEEQESR